jgi:hypothetical protein
MSTTVTLLEYYEFAAALFVIYLLVRTLIWAQLRMELREDSESRLESEPSNVQSHPIDTTELEHRLQEVRRDYAAEARAHPSAVNKPLLVAERREEIAKMAFFQKPPPEPESPGKEHGSPLLLAL